MNQHERTHSEARTRTELCKQWILRLMNPGQEKPATKDELFEMACTELEITRRNFDDAWFLAIRETGRNDWYKPYRKKSGDLT